MLPFHYIAFEEKGIHLIIKDFGNDTSIVMEYV